MRKRRPRRIDQGPRPLAASLDEAVSRLLPPGSDRAPAAPSPATVLARWEEIAGPSLARHVHPLRLSGDVLVVVVDHPAWATEVRSLSETILGRVGEISGQAPSRIEVTVRAGRNGLPSRSGPQPLR